MNRVIVKRMSLALLAAGFFLFGQTGRGNAQVETPSPEPGFTVTASDVTPTPLAENTVTATVMPLETESATPVIVIPSPDAGNLTDSSSAVVQILIQIQASADLPVDAVQGNLELHGKLVQMDELKKLGIVVLEVPLDQLESRMEEIQSLAGVDAVELNDAVQALDTIPNDPQWGSQYALTAIRAPQGWDLSTGSGAVTIAILDSGVDLGHADLAGKIVDGYDFVNNDNVPQDDYGHGTHVAGIAAASGNNGVGIAGVSWGARIMPVKVLNSSGGGNFAVVAQGIVWAADHGAQIINLSLGAPSASFTLQNAVEYAYNKGALLIAASGNSGSTPVYCPACYPQVMAVGATDANNQIASFSTYGIEVDIAAPGQNILSLAPGGYMIKSGTSMSAPHVSGLAAILFAYSGSAAAVRNAMQATALDVGPYGWDQYSGPGLIQMDAAIRYLIPPTSTPTSTASSSNGNNRTAQSYGNLIQSGITLLPTLSPPASLQTATATQTFVPLTASLTPVPAGSMSPTVSSSSGSSRLLKKMTVFQSAPFCLGMIMLMLGMLLIWFTRRNRH